MKTGCGIGPIAVRDFGVVIEHCRGRLGCVEQADAAVRLFHGRGHCFPGYEDLTVDLFSSYAVVTCFGDDAQGARSLAQLIGESFPAITGVCIQVRKGRKTNSANVVDTVPEEVTVVEDGLRYLVRPHRNQNVGLFLDMAPTRQWLRQHCEGRRVLNLFAYTCAFSVAAIAGGAELVVNNDMSRSALQWGRENHQLNEHDLRKVRMLPNNLFKSWRKIRQFAPYDLVVIDPPTNQRGSFVADRQYGQVLKRIPDFSAKNAEIVACLNSPFLNSDFLTQQMARWSPSTKFIEYLPVAADFPDLYPDRGLKIALFRFEG